MNNKRIKWSYLNKVECWSHHMHKMQWLPQKRVPGCRWCPSPQGTQAQICSRAFHIPFTFTVPSHTKRSLSYIIASSTFVSLRCKTRLPFKMAQRERWRGSFTILFHFFFYLDRHIHSSLDCPKSKGSSVEGAHYLILFVLSSYQHFPCMLSVLY